MTYRLSDFDGTPDAADWLTVGHVLDEYEVEFLRNLPIEGRLLERGDHVTLYEGMGEYSLGIVEALRPAGVLVRFNGYIEPNGTRNEPWAAWVHETAVTKDHDPEASRRTDQESMLPGYTVIEATLPPE